MLWKIDLNIPQFGFFKYGLSVHFDEFVSGMANYCKFRSFRGGMLNYRKFRIFHKFCNFRNFPWVFPAAL